MIEAKVFLQKTLASITMANTQDSIRGSSFFTNLNLELSFSSKNENLECPYVKYFIVGAKLSLPFVKLFF